jgi:iron complex transport system substrate-binding protein
MNKKFCAVILILLFLITGCGQTSEVKDEKANIEDKIHFTDDFGEEIILDKPAKRIISLYSAHTENLFSLGLDEDIIGVGKSDAFPPQVRTKEVFDYRSDPEKVINANPDLVLIRPFINRGNPEFVEALKKANITVVSLYPEKFADFPKYIKKLAMLTGKEKEAEMLLAEFNNDLEEIKNKTSKIEPKVKVYFESTENEYRTITNDSMAAKAISLAGGINIASDAKALREGTSIASYGVEKILEKAEEIDVFVSQRGAMNSGGNEHSISIRPGFHAIKAVREGRIYTIDEKFVSSPTFRFAKGVHELARMFYPELMDDLSCFADKESITRGDMAQIAVMYKHKGLFSPTSKYYKKKHEGHTYGDFADVAVDHPLFDYIETACLAGYMEEDGKNFYPDKKITRDELAQTLFMLTDLRDCPTTKNIKDLDKCTNQRIVQLVVDNGLLDLKANYFKPDDTVTGEEVVKALNNIK